VQWQQLLTGAGDRGRAATELAEFLRLRLISLLRGAAKVFDADVGPGPGRQRRRARPERLLADPCRCRPEKDRED